MAWSAAAALQRLLHRNVIPRRMPVGRTGDGRKTKTSTYRTQEGRAPTSNSEREGVTNFTALRTG